MDNSPDNLPEARPLDRTPQPITEDLYCLGCGYNLRGLSGPMVRCPECGEVDDVSDLNVPAHEITKALKRMESDLTCCVGSALGILTCALTLLGGISCSVIMGLVFVFAWVIFFTRVGDRFDRRPGWWRVVLGFHAAAALGFTHIVLVVVIFWLDYAKVIGDVGWCLQNSFIISVPAYVLAILLACKARNKLKAMQRDKAVRIARERLRKLRRRNRKG